MYLQTDWVENSDDNVKGFPSRLYHSFTVCHNIIANSYIHYRTSSLKLHGSREVPADRTPNTLSRLALPDLSVKHGRRICSVRATVVVGHHIKRSH